MVDRDPPSCDPDQTDDPNQQEKLRLLFNEMYLVKDMDISPRGIISEPKDGDRTKTKDCISVLNCNSHMPQE